MARKDADRKGGGPRYEPASEFHAPVMPWKTACCTGAFWCKKGKKSEPRGKPDDECQKDTGSAIAVPTMVLSKESRPSKLTLAPDIAHVLSMKAGDATAKVFDNWKPPALTISLANGTVVMTVSNIVLTYVSTGLATIKFSFSGDGWTDNLGNTIPVVLHAYAETANGGLLDDWNLGKIYAGCGGNGKSYLF